MTTITIYMITEVRLHLSEHGCDGVERSYDTEPVEAELHDDYEVDENRYGHAGVWHKDDDSKRIRIDQAVKRGILVVQS